MKNRLRLIITWIVLVIGVFYLYHNRAQLTVLRHISPKNLGILFFLSGLLSYLTGLTLKAALEILEIKISHFETFGLSILTNFSNYLGPGSPGSVMKAIYLKSTKQLDYTRYAALFFLVNFLGVFVTGLMGGITFFWAKGYQGTLPFAFLWISLGLILTGIVPFFYKIPKIIPRGRVQEILSLAAEGFEQMRLHRYYLLKIAEIYFLQFLLSALIFKFTFGSMNVHLSFSASLFLAVFMTAANFVVITPNNLGIQEAVNGTFFKLLGLDFAQGVIGMGLMRIIYSIITFALTPFFIQTLFKNKGLAWKAPRP